MRRVTRFQDIILQVFVFFFLFSPMGKAFAEWDWDVQGSSSASYDSNITNASRNETADWITRWRVGLGGTYETKTQKFDARANLVRNIFWDQSVLNNNSGDFDLKYSREISEHHRWRMNTRFERAEEVTGFDDLLGTLAGRYVYHRNRLRMEYDHDIARQLRLATYYTNEMYRVSREGLSDSDEHGVGVALQWLQSSATVLSLAYQLSTREYHPGGRITVNAVLAGVRQYLTRRFFVDVMAGASRRVSDSINQSVQPRVLVAANYEWNETDSFHLELANSSVSNQSTVDVLESWLVTLSLVRRVWKRLQMEAAIFYGEGEFETTSITEDAIGFSSRLRYDLTENVKVFTSLGLTGKSSNVFSREYNKGLWTIGLEFIF